MNAMNDERFFDLAMKVIARQCTDAERAELDALLAKRPELKAEFERLQTEVRVAKEALPLVNATEATTGELPAYARGRLQTKVRQTLGRPQSAGAPERDKELSFLWRWRWVLGLAAATAVVVLALLPVLRPPSRPFIQLAMLDVTGAMRGAETNEVALLQRTWETAGVDSFSDAESLRAWETNWPAKRETVKIIYDRNAAEVRVAGRWKGRSFDRVFAVEPDLASTLAKAKAYLSQELRP